MNKGIRCISVAVLMGLFLSALPQAADAGLYDAWAYRLKLSFTNQLGGSLTNFPLLVKLDTSVTGFSYTDFTNAATGADLRFADSSGMTNLNYEIEKWDTNGTSFVWVQAPLLSSTNDFIYSYWGRAVAAPASQTDGSVWTNGYAGVWHLNESSGASRDSTTNLNHASASNGVTMAVTGLVGGAVALDGTNDFLTAPHHSSLALVNNFTVETWVRRTADGNFDGFVSKSTNSVNGWNLNFNNNSDRFAAFIGGASSRYLDVDGAATPVDFGWHQMALRVSGGTANVYFDGVQQAATTNVTLTESGQRLVFGAFYSAADNHFLAGLLDEIRISKVARSTNWLAACYLNQKADSRFVTYAVALPQAGPAVISLLASGIAATGVRMNGEVAATGGAENPTVYFCWDYSDKGASGTGIWAHVDNVGSGWSAGQSFSNDVGGLLVGSNYAYRCYVTNSTGDHWSGVQTFKAADPATVSNPGAFVGVNAALLRAEVTSTGGDTPTVWFNYWRSDLSTTTTVGMGQQAGAFSTNVYGLLPGSNYSYLVTASNASGWVSSEVKGFVPEALPAAQFVVDSVSDFAVCTGKQGQANWYYGYHRADLAAYTGTNFIPFPDDKGAGVATNDFWNGTYWAWYVNPPWTRIANNWMHPDIGSGQGTHWVIRRYVVPTNAWVSISYRVYDNDTGGGDGVDAYIYVNGVSNIYHSITNGNTVGFSGQLTNVLMTTGSTIDFVVGPKAGVANDQTVFTASITGQVVNVTTVADYKDDFQGPAPKANWQYLWNSNGIVTVVSNYASMGWDPAGFYDANGPGANPAPNPASWVLAASTYVHPGAGTANGSTVDRFSIAAYTVRKTALYYMTPAYVRLQTAAGGIELRVRVNSNDRFTQVITATNLVPLSLNLGELASNDTVYVAVGPNGINTSDALALDYTLSEIANLTVRALPASNITAGGARLNGQLFSAGGVANPAIYFCWDYADKGTFSTSLWAHVDYLGTNWGDNASFSNDVAGLASGSNFTYRCYAANATDNDWSSPTNFTMTGLPPAITNLGAHAGRGAAILQAAVTATQGETPWTWFRYWNTGQATTTTVAMGLQSGAFSYTLTGLNTASNYSYLAVVSNSSGVATTEVKTFTPDTGDFDDWAYRMKISFTNVLSAPLTNFPVLVVLGTNIAGFSYDGFAAPSSGADLRFGDSGEITNLNHEIEKWDSSGNSHVWVQMPLLSSTNDYIYAYWGRSGETPPAYTTNGAAWTESFTWVAHLSETSGNQRDSTTNANHGSVASGVIQGTAAAIGGGDQFAGTNIAEAVFFGQTGKPSVNFTFEAWIQASEGQSNDVEASSGVTGAGLGRYHHAIAAQVELTAGTAGAGLSIGTNGMTVFEHSGGYLPPLAVYTGTVGTAWNHIAVVYTENRPTIFMNGAAVRQGLQSTKTVFAPYQIGAHYYGAFKGMIDEVRVSSVSRSTAWLQACWQNQRPGSRFVTAGAVEPFADTLLVSALPAAGVSSGGATMIGRVVNTGGAGNPQVVVCWDFTDKEASSTGSWAHADALGTSWGAGQAFSNVVSGLAAGSTYVYRCYATNSTGESWSGTESFRAVSPPVVTNTGAMVGSGAVTLRATVTSTGGETPNAWVYYWIVGQSTTTTVARYQQSGAFTTELAGLSAGSNYAYKVLAQNYAGSAWSGTETFTPVAAAVPDGSWTSRLVTAAFYEGDGLGTVVHDVYVDGASTASNFNGQGLSFKWNGVGILERPGYIRFQNFLGQIPAGSFVYRARLQLTATASSIGSGWLKVAARGAYTFDEATVTYANMSNKGAIAPNASSQNQLYSKYWGASLVSNQTIAINVAPAVRAWFDSYQNPAHGYTNAGFVFNINPSGAGGASDPLYFADSENADSSKRPRLVVEYLPPSSGYRAMFYGPVVTNTAQTMRVVPQDAPIGMGSVLPTNNYGGVLGGYNLSSSDGPSSVLVRWPSFQMPPGRSYQVVDAKIRYGGVDGWNIYTYSANIEVRQCLQPWVEGSGTVAVPSYVGATFTNFNAVAGNPAANRWQTAGGTGAADSWYLCGLAGVTLGDGEVQDGDASGRLANLVASWIEGNNANGLLIRATTGTYPLNLATLGGNYQDPYHALGVIVIFRNSHLGTSFIFR